MINNTLLPEEYGGYMVQDAAYIFDAIKAFDIAAESMQGKSPPDFALFYRGRSASFQATLPISPPSGNSKVQKVWSWVQQLQRMLHMK